MATRIRLQRHGKKHQAFFHLVVADGRAPRDGKYIEKLGTYNPKTNPATIDLNFDRALYWLQTGAQPSDTAKAVLMYKGVIYKNHLLKGVTKKALTLEQAEAKFAKWMNDKTAKIEGKKTTLVEAKKDSYKKRMEAEKEVKAKKAEKIAAKNTPPVVEAAAPEATEGAQAAE
ncbi:MAG: 30S ribosomal protein S16 [Bacteroidetes bacterium]|nr:30S ribosomal protein S16 [Bacteroidota bacterium]